MTVWGWECIRAMSDEVPDPSIEATSVQSWLLVQAHETPVVLLCKGFKAY
ncbi:MAG: hypothetical protein QOE23_3076, partial [Pseudonocardiales bacterium]|nr:hypothetical protein [Pseudonocardiales bacterium]